MDDLTNNNPVVDGDVTELENHGNDNYKYVLYAVTALIALAGLYVAYLYVSSDKDFGYKIEWKFWNSSVLWPALSFIGFFLQFIDWQHTSFKEGWVVKDSWGREKFVEDNDIMSTLWGSCLFPLLAHFLLIPCMYGAMLYYVIMIPLALVNALIPYLAALLAIAIAVLFYSIARNFEWKSSPWVWLAGTAIVCLSLLWLLSLPTSSSFNFGSSDDTTSTSALPAAVGHASVTANVANLRTGPGTEYDFYLQANGEKLQVTKGDDIQIVEDNGEWFKILTADGSTAYIKKTLCTDMEYYQTADGQAEEIDCDTDEADEAVVEADAEEEQQADEAATKADVKAAAEADVRAAAEAMASSQEASSIESVSAPASIAASTEKVYDVVEQMPAYPGGQNGLFNYLSQSIKYPVIAEENGVQGRVIVKFIVERDGSISNIQVVKSVDPSLDKEAVRVTKSMPHWVPGKQNGETVRVYYTMPVTFRLQ